jgi:hypothetical protein
MVCRTLHLQILAASAVVFCLRCGVLDIQPPPTQMLQKTLAGVHIFHGNNIGASRGPTHAYKTLQIATFSNAAAPNPLTFSMTNQKTTKTLQTVRRFARKHDFARDLHTKMQKSNGPISTRETHAKRTFSAKDTET